MNKPISILAGLFLFLCFGYIGVVPGANEIFIPYLFLILYLFISELYKKQPNPLNNWAYAMMSQIYIALSFALLNVLAYHSSATESVSQYNPILPLLFYLQLGKRYGCLLYRHAVWKTPPVRTYFPKEIVGRFYRWSRIQHHCSHRFGTLLYIPEHWCMDWTGTDCSSIRNMG